MQNSPGEVIQFCTELSLRVKPRYNPFRKPTVAMGAVLQEEAMTEMEMVRELRRVVAHMAGQAGGNREKIKAEVRAELASAIKERFGGYLDEVNRQE